MNDEDVEGRLRRYRPAAPSSELRDRVIGTDKVIGTGKPIGSVRLQADGSGLNGLWWQLVTAAALVVAAALLHSATERVDRRIALATAPERAADERALDDLARELGDGPSARLVAEAILVRERVLERRAVSTQEMPQ